MAISSLIDPSGYPSVHGNLFHIATSDNTNKPNFKFIFDLHETDGTQLMRAKVYPDPNNDKGYFDAAAVIANTVSVDWFNPINGFVTKRPDLNGEIGKQYEIRVGEEFSSGNTFASNLNLASGAVTAYNYFPDLWNSQPRDNISAKFNNFLTNRPLRLKVPWNENVIMIPFHNTSVLSGSGNIYTSLASKTQINFPSATFTFTLSSEEGSNFYQLNISRNGLSGLSSGATFYEAGYYELTINGKKIIVEYDCKPLYEPVVLYFINAYGMFDTAVFNLVNKLNLKVNRKSYTKSGLLYNTSKVSTYGNVTGGRLYNETKVNYAQNVDWNFKLMMEAPTDAEYEWLSELMYSPLIYMKYQGSYYPVTLVNTNYEYSKYTFNKLKNLEIEVEVNQSRKGISR
jgi:hypothetical protein